MTGFEVSDVADFLDALKVENKELNAKIAEANKILNEYPLPFGMVDDWKKVQSWLDRLKNALLIPRKEPQIHGLPTKQVLKEVAKGLKNCEGEAQK